jgi:hypothetical protein
MTEAEMAKIRDDIDKEDSKAKAALVSWFESQDIPTAMAIGIMAGLIADIAEKFLAKGEKSKLADNLIRYLAARLYSAP